VKITRSGRLAAIAAVTAATALVLTGCAANESGSSTEDLNLSGLLTGAGASSQASAQEAWIASFQSANPKLEITYDPTGSGAGRESFIAGAVNFAGTDSYLKDEELAGTFAACAPDTLPFEVPAYISPIAIAYNVEGVDSLNLDASTIAKIFSGAITSWDDPAIVALNPKATLPALAITAVHRSDDSGTTKNFSDYLFQNAKTDWAIEKPGDTFPFESGEGAQGTSGVVAAIENGTGTIGYADASKVSKLTTAKIKVGSDFIAYSPEAAAAVVDGSPAVKGRDAADMAIDINRTTTNPDEYPLVLVSYLIGCQEYADAKVAPLVKNYIKFILSAEGQQVAVTSAGAAPLSAAQSEAAIKIVDAIK